MRRLAFVFNPVSGQKRGESVVAELRERLDGFEGFKTRTTATQPGDDGPRQVEFCAGDDCVLFGGDGTANKFVNALGDARPAVAFFGAGTINVLSRALRLPQAVDAFAAMLRSRKLVEVPISSLGARSRFLMFYEVGFMGRIVCRVNEWRSRRQSHSKLPFVWFTVRELCRIWPRRYSIRVGDEGAMRGPYSNVLVTRVEEYAGTMRVPIEGDPECPICERSFQVVGLRTRWFGTSLFVLAVMASGLLPACVALLRWAGFLETFRAQKLVVEGMDVPSVCHVDAESCNTPPPHALSFTEKPLTMYVP